MATQLKSGYPVTQLATQLKSEVLYFVTKLGSQKLGSQRVSGENFTVDMLWLPSSGYPVKRRGLQAPLPGNTAPKHNFISIFSKNLRFFISKSI
jgi:hypothetical protein